MSALSTWFYRTNISAVLGSVVFASVLWLYVQLTDRYEYSVNIPVTITNIRKDKILKYPIPSAVVVQLEGTGAGLMAYLMLWSSETRFMLNLETINEFWKCPPDRYMHWISLPQESQYVTIERIISPDTITVELDFRAEKLLPVSRDNISIQLRPGNLLMGSIVFQPESVMVTGPQSIVRDIKAVLTNPRTFAEGPGEYSGEIGIAQFENTQTLVAPASVNVTFKIERIAERTFEDIPVKVLNVPKNVQVQIKPQTIRLTLHGGEDFIERLSPEDIEAGITYRNEWTRKNVYQSPVQILYPENVVHFDALPNSLEVSVQ